MNHTIKDATITRYHYESHEQLRTPLSDFHDAYNYALRLKTLSGLTPYEYICKIWTSGQDRFILNTIHQMLGLNTQRDKFFAHEYDACCYACSGPLDYGEVSFKLKIERQSEAVGAGGRYSDAANLRY